MVAPLQGWQRAARQKLPELPKDACGVSELGYWF
jgi:hypothetical protein